MKTKIFSLSVFILLFINGFSQVTDAEKKLRESKTDTIAGWKSGAVLSINASQSSFTNWAAGGQNSLALNGLSSLYANYTNKKSSWDNTFDIGYGKQKQGKDAGWLKTDDKIDFSSKYGKMASEKWYYAALLNFKTQMDAGYKYPNDSVPISDFLAPAYLIAAVGMDFKPNKNLSAFVAPVTAKTTLVNNKVLADSGAYGVEKAILDNAGQVITPGKKIRNEFGGYIKIAYQKNEIVKNVNLNTKIELFSNYLQNAKNVDVSWEVLIAMKVNKYITATISTHLLYDDDVAIAVDTNNDDIPDKMGPRTQFKQVIGIGLSYKFSN